MSVWLPDNGDGEHAYVVTSSSPWRTYSWVVYAETMADAKAQHGWTRELHCSRRVRRARLTDSELRVENQPVRVVGTDRQPPR